MSKCIGLVMKDCEHMAEFGQLCSGCHRKCLEENVETLLGSLREAAFLLGKVYRSEQNPIYPPELIAVYNLCIETINKIDERYLPSNNTFIEKL
jgi:hypothetical protein